MTIRNVTRIFHRIFGCGIVLTISTRCRLHPVQLHKADLHTPFNLCRVTQRYPFSQRSGSASGVGNTSCRYAHKRTYLCNSFVCSTLLFEQAAKGSAEFIGTQAGRCTGEVASPGNLFNYKTRGLPNRENRN